MRYSSPNRSRVVEVVLGGLGHADGEELAGEVPFVEGFGGVDPLVALEPDERGVQYFGQHLGGLGLADPGLAFEQQRLGEPDGAEQRGGDAVVGEVADFRQRGLQALRVMGPVGPGPSMARC